MEDKSKNKKLVQNPMFAAQVGRNSAEEFFALVNYFTHHLFVAIAHGFILPFLRLYRPRFLSCALEWEAANII